MFCAELPIFYREHRNGMYRTDVYFICKTLAETPIFLAVPFLFTAIAYPMIGLYPDMKHFFVAGGIVALVANVATSFGKIEIGDLSFSSRVFRFCESFTRRKSSGRYLKNKKNCLIFLTGYLISCISNGVSMALSVGPPVIIPFLLFGGFFLNIA